MNSMILALTREESLKRRLQSIQRTIAACLYQGLTEPETRAAQSQQVAQLAQEARTLSQQPLEYQPPEPWQAADPEERQLLVALTVNAAFRQSPQDHILTDCLIAHWQNRLLVSAEQGDPAEWRRSLVQLAADAGAVKPCSTAPGAIPAGVSAPQLIEQLQQHQEILATRMAPSPGDCNTPLAAAYTEALDHIGYLIQWLAAETPPQIDWARNGDAANLSIAAVKGILRQEYRNAANQLAELETLLPGPASTQTA